LALSRVGPWFVTCVFTYEYIADFWEVFDIVVCIYTYDIVVYHPDSVCPRFVRETKRYKPRNTVVFELTELLSTE